MSVFKDSVWKQILDGKRDWKVPEQTLAACDLFDLQTVLPLSLGNSETRGASGSKKSQHQCPVGDASSK